MSRLIPTSCSAQPSRQTGASGTPHIPHFPSPARPTGTSTPAHPQPTDTARRTILIGALWAAIAPSLAAFVPPPAAAAATELPQRYVDTARSLVDALREAVYSDLNGDPEREVRRKADPAKDLVRQFMTRWRDEQEVSGEVSYSELTAAIRQLGEFYLKNGQRARLSDEVGQALLARLDAAEAALPPPPEKKSLLPF